MGGRNKEVGAWGEEQAARFLIQQGYTIITRNFHSRNAEIDIIAWHEKEHFGKTLCFVEVKTRAVGARDSTRATGIKKVEQMKIGASMYCRASNIDVQATPIQFEHVSVVFDSTKKTVSCTVYPIIH